MIIVDILASGGLRLTDDQTGEVYEVASDADGQRLGRLIRRLAREKYATGYADGLTEAELREQRGPVRRARLALN